MGLRIMIDRAPNNPNLPVTYPEARLINTNLIAGYNMRSNRDFSGNGRHFSWGGEFNEQGAVLTPDVSRRISTPVMDSEAITIVTCTNITASADAGIILSNAQTGPTQGFEVRKRPSLTDAQLQIAISNGSGFATGSYPFVGWRMNIFTMDLATLKASNGAGSQTTLSFGGNRRLGLIPWFMNGLPDGYGAAGVTVGVNGILGCALFYNKVYTQAELAPIAAAVRQMMALRGIVI